MNSVIIKYSKTSTKDSEWHCRGFGCTYRAKGHAGTRRVYGHASTCGRLASSHPDLFDQVVSLHGSKSLGAKMKVRACAGTAIIYCPSSLYSSVSNPRSLIKILVMSGSGIR